MPAPFTLVYIVDADGDEFPIRVEADLPDTPEANEAATETAAMYFADFVRRGEMRPTEPIQWDKTRIERVGGE